MKAATGGLYFLLLLLMLLAFSGLSSIDGKHKASHRSAALTEKAREKILGESGQQPPFDEETLTEIRKQVELVLSDINSTISSCTSQKKTRLEALAGDWQLAYYKDKGKRAEVAIHLQPTAWEGVKMLLGSLKEAGNPREYIIQLVQLADVAQPAILFSLLPVGEHIIKLPVLLVDVLPERYFTVFQTGLLLPQYIDWAVYVRPGVRLTGPQLRKATAGLRCLKMGDGEAEGEADRPLVYPVGRGK